MSLLAAIKSAIAQGVEVMFIPGEHGLVTMVSAISAGPDAAEWAEDFHCAVPIHKFQGADEDFVAGALVRSTVEVRQRELASQVLGKD